MRGRQLITAVYTVLMIAAIVAIDVFLLRHQFRERLAVNVGLVLLFGACYSRFVKRP